MSASSREPRGQQAVRKRMKLQGGNTHTHTHTLASAAIFMRTCHPFPFTENRTPRRADPTDLSVIG